VKKAVISRRKPSPKKPVAELTPTPDPPAERAVHKIIMNVFGKRYELRSHVEVRAITKGPAKVIEMPRRLPL
jgi:hypothetical protein